MCKSQSLILICLALALGPGQCIDIGGAIKDTVNSAADNINKVVDLVGNTACIVSHGTEFDQCNQKMETYLQRDKVEKSEMKDFCCAYIAYRDCVEEIAEKRCGSKAAETIDVYMNALKAKVMSDECANYNNFFDCMDTTLFIVVVAVLVLIGVAIIATVLCLVKRCCC